MIFILRCLLDSNKGKYSVFILAIVIAVLLAFCMTFGLPGCGMNKKQNIQGNIRESLVLKLKRLPSEDSDTIHWVEELQNTSNDTLYVTPPTFRRNVSLVAEWRTIDDKLQLVYLDSPDKYPEDVGAYPAATGYSEGSGVQELKPLEVIEEKLSCKILHAGMYHFESCWHLYCGNTKNDVVELDVCSGPLKIEVKRSDSVGYVGEDEAMHIADEEIVKSGQMLEGITNFVVQRRSNNDNIWEIRYKLGKKENVKEIIVYIDRRTGKAVIQER